MKKLLAAAVVATGALSGVSSAEVVVDLVNPAGDVTTVPVGALITARVSASTNSSFGISQLSARITTSSSAGGAADAAPFFAHVIPSTADPDATQPPIHLFNPAISSASNVQTLAPNLDFEDGVPNGTNVNRPSFGFIGKSIQNVRGAPQFFSSGNSSLTHFFDVTFRANEVGTVFFSLTPNPGMAAEYTAATGMTETALAVPTFAPGAGFQVNIVPVPEPTAVALAGLGCAALLLRRRRNVVGA